MVKRNIKLKKVTFFIAVAEISEKIKIAIIIKKMSEKYFRMYWTKKIL